MGEIRSTIDIMMDRTKGLSLSDEEKKAFKLEELQKRAKGLHLKLTQTPTLVESLLNDIRENEEEDIDKLRSLLWNTFVENLPLGSDNDSYLELMRKLPVSLDRTRLLSELQKELKAHAKNRMKARKVALAAERKRLAASGISGTAVVPKLKSDNEDTKDLVEKYKKLLIYDIN